MQSSNRSTFIEFSQKSEFEAAIQCIKSRSDEVMLFVAARYISNKATFRLSIPDEQFRDFLEVLGMMPDEPKGITVELTTIAGEIQETPPRKKQKLEHKSDVISQSGYSIFPPQSIKMSVIPKVDACAIFCDLVLEKLKNANCEVLENILEDQFRIQLKDLCIVVGVDYFNTNTDLDSLATMYCDHFMETRTLDTASLFMLVNAELLMNFRA